MEDYNKRQDLDEMGVFLANRNAEKRNNCQVVRKAPLHNGKETIKSIAIKGVASVLALSTMAGLLVFAKNYKNAKADLLYEQVSNETAIIGVEESQYSRGGYDAVYSDGLKKPLSQFDDVEEPSFFEVFDEIFEDNIQQPMYEERGRSK